MVDFLLSLHSLSFKGAHNASPVIDLKKTAWNKHAIDWHKSFDSSRKEAFICCSVSTALWLEEILSYLNVRLAVWKWKLG